MKSILIGILNWNSTDRTIQCIHSMLPYLNGPGYHASIRVIDNGSVPEQVAALRDQLPGQVELQLSAVNTGFAGGQNINLRHAMEHGYDLVWLLNNDTVCYPDTLEELVKVFDEDALCAAASPVVLRMGKPEIVDFCGAIHDWKPIDTLRPASLAEAPDFLEKHQDHVWAVGTALMLRVSMLRELGNLDESYFAYYEDDDLGARVIKKGWRTRIALKSRIEHACFEGNMYQRPPYFFYLMTRNAIFFALRHVPAPYRRALRLRHADRSAVMASKLLVLGYEDKAMACLLGLADGLSGRGGAPSLDRKPPLWVMALVPMRRLLNKLA